MLASPSFLPLPVGGVYEEPPTLELTVRIVGRETQLLMLASGSMTPTLTETKTKNKVGLGELPNTVDAETQQFCATVRTT